MKKKMLITVLCCLFSILGYSQHNKDNFTLSADLKKLKATEGIVYFKTKYRSKVEIKKFKISSEKINCSFYVEKPTLVYITFNDKKIKKFTRDKKKRRFFTPSSCLTFIAYPNKSISIKGEITDYVKAFPSGDIENDLLSKLNRSIYKDMNSSVNLLAKFMTKGISLKDKKYLENIKYDLDDKIDKLKLAFVKKHISSIAGINAARDIVGYAISEQDINEYISRIDKKYHNLSYYRDLILKINSLKDRRIAKERTSVGNIVPSIVTKNTLTGDRFNITDLRGKYVIIDFWGTWCSFCIKGMPKLNEFYNKHKSKVEILAIALELRGLKPWKAFLDKNKYNWNHIYNGKKDEDFVKMFGISAFPTKILISPKGKILLVQSGISKDFYTKVEKLMKL